MSVRRLAPDNIQPASFEWSKASLEKVAFWLAKYPEGRQRSAVIPLLWLAQKQERWVSRPALEKIAEQLSMPYMRVYEVVTFYTMFHLAPVGKHHLQVCGTTPCMLRGSGELIKICKNRIGEHHHVTEDGLLSWEEMECLGACTNAPVVMIHDYYHEDLDPASFEKLIDDLAADKEVVPASAIGRQKSAPIGGPTTLQDAKLYDGSLAKKIKIPNLPAKG
ncbi:MAG: NADH-quinone oxidoreductase subunit E [Hyphomonadaceae bacterium]|nr:MAG: NADH-quinone oxidoreductase subunit E [Hyphomonadaceae bacterium]